MRKTVFAVGFSLVFMGVAGAQEGAPEGEQVEPPGMELEAGSDEPAPQVDPGHDILKPLDTGPESGVRPWLWPTNGQVQLRMVYEDLRLDLEAEHVKGTDDPFGTRQSRRRIDYESRHTSARLEASYGISFSEDLSLSVRGGLGWGTTTITVESKNGSDLSGGGPDFETNLETEVDFNLGFGLDARWRSGNLFFGATYNLLYGRGTFDDQLMYSIVEGSIDYLTHDVYGIFGVTLGELVSFYGGAGAVFYWNSMSLDERGGPDRWDVNLEQDQRFKGVLGIALHSGPLSAWIQFQFVFRPSMTMGIGYSF